MSGACYESCGELPGRLAGRVMREGVGAKRRYSSAASALGTQQSQAIAGYAIEKGQWNTKLRGR